MEQKIIFDEDFKDPYIYENGVLKNLAGITDFEQLKKFEYEITRNKLIEMFYKKFDFEKLCSVEGYKGLHKKIFSEIYDWAGDLRVCDITKNNTNFCPVFLLDNCLRNTLNIIYKDIDKLKDPVVLAKYYSDLNYVHPFREGNGRIQHFFWNVLLRRHKLHIDFDSISKDYKEEFYVACREGANKGDNHNLEGLFKAFLVPVKGVEKIEQRQVFTVARSL